MNVKKMKYHILKFIYERNPNFVYKYSKSYHGLLLGEEISKGFLKGIENRRKRNESGN